MHAKQSSLLFFSKIDYDSFRNKDPITSIEINKRDKGFSLFMLNTSKIFYYNWQVILILKNRLNTINKMAKFLTSLVQYPTGDLCLLDFQVTKLPTWPVFI